MSSEDWEDRIQSEDSTSFTSSCGSDPEISANEEPEHQSEAEGQGQTGNLQGMTQSSIHVMNILHPVSTIQCLNSQTPNSFVIYIVKIRDLPSDHWIIPTRDADGITNS